MSTRHSPTKQEDRAPSKGPCNPFIQPDLVLANVLSDWLQDDELWVPQTPAVDFKPCMLAASQGYFVNLLRVRRSGILSRHRHAGPVHALVLRGRWHYLEHDWVANEGTYIYETPGDIHTLIVPDGVDEMITWFHNTGGYTYVDADGKPTGYEDVFTKLSLAREHYKKIGLGEDYVKRFVR